MEFIRYPHHPIWNVHSAFLLMIDKHKYSMLCFKNLQISEFAVFSVNFAFFLRLALERFLLGSIFMILRIFKFYLNIYFSGFLSFWAEHPVLYDIFSRYVRVSNFYTVEYSWWYFFQVKFIRRCIGGSYELSAKYCWLSRSIWVYASRSSWVGSASWFVACSSICSRIRSSISAFTRGPAW